MKIIKEKKIYTGRQVIEDGYIRFGEKITEVDSMRCYEPKEEDEVIDFPGEYIAVSYTHLDVYKRQPVQ